MGSEPCHPVLALTLSSDHDLLDWLSVWNIKAAPRCSSAYVAHIGGLAHSFAKHNMCQSVWMRELHICLMYLLGNDPNKRISFFLCSSSSSTPLCNASRRNSCDLGEATCDSMDSGHCASASSAMTVESSSSISTTVSESAEFVTLGHVSGIIPEVRDVSNTDLSAERWITDKTRCRLFLLSGSGREAKLEGILSNSFSSKRNDRRNLRVGDIYRWGGRHG